MSKGWGAGGRVLTFVTYVNFGKVLSRGRNFKNVGRDGQMLDLRPARLGADVERRRPRRFCSRRHSRPAGGPRPPA